MTVLFCLPQASPVTVDSMNYAVVALAAALLLATAWWYAARKTYSTPRLPADSAEFERRDAEDAALGE